MEQVSSLASDTRSAEITSEGMHSMGCSIERAMEKLGSSRGTPAPSVAERKQQELQVIITIKKLQDEGVYTKEEADKEIEAAKRRIDSFNN